MKTKTCSACREEKSLEDFFVRKDRPSGRASRCRACSKKTTTVRTKPESKLCAGCGEEKSLDDFYKRNGRSTRGLGRMSRCKKCLEKVRTSHPYYKQNTFRRAQYVRDQVAKDPDWYRRQNIWRNYKITLEQFDELLERQGGACVVCGGPPKGKGNRYHVDHNHVTGKIRGLLCHKCNVALGMVQDSVEHLAALIAYLKHHAEITA